MPNSPKTIACLPIAGSENPYQQLMMQGLRDAGFEVRHGVGGKWFAFTRTWLGQRPGFVHLDWPGSYYLRRSSPLALAQFLGLWLDLMTFKLIGGRLVWTCHNLKEHEVPHPGLDRRAKRLLGWAAWTIRVFSEGQRQAASEYLGVGMVKLVVVPEGSYVGYYPDTITKAEARRALGLPEDSRVLVNFGNLRPYKGVDRLIEVFNRLKPEGWRLLVAGPAHNKAYVEELRRLAGGNPDIVLRPGFIQTGEVQQYMRAADLAVLPFNRIDNSGSVILAMGFSLPVVAPAVGAVQGRLSGQPKLLFSIEGPKDGFEEILATAMAMSELELRAIGNQNKEAVELFTWRDFGSVFKAGSGQ